MSYKNELTAAQLLFYLEILLNIILKSTLQPNKSVFEVMKVHCSYFAVKF